MWTGNSDVVSVELSRPPSDVDRDDVSVELSRPPSEEGGEAHWDTALERQSTLPEARESAAVQEKHPTWLLELAGEKQADDGQNVDIQLVGMRNVGKTALLETLIRQEDPASLPEFLNRKKGLVSHHHVMVKGRLLKILDCSGHVRASNLVKEWLARSRLTLVVYDMSKAQSLEDALDLAIKYYRAGAHVVLFGNRFEVDRGKSMAVDVHDLRHVRDIADRCQGVAMESSNLMDAVKGGFPGLGFNQSTTTAV